MSKLRLLVADDHPMFLEGLCTVLSLRDPDLEIVATACNGEEAVHKDAETDPDLLLLDIRMPKMDGVAAAGLIKKRRPEVKIIMLTTFDDTELIAGALQAGANGYILKDTPVPEIVEAIRTVCRGGVLISPQVATKLSLAKSALEPGLKKLAPKELHGLTPREREILLLMARGKENREIARELYISEKTVRNCVTRIYDVLGVHSRAQAVVWAVEHELV